jgi:hypothetical protein
MPLVSWCTVSNSEVQCGNIILGHLVVPNIMPCLPPSASFPICCSPVALSTLYSSPSWKNRYITKNKSKIILTPQSGVLLKLIVVKLATGPYPAPGTCRPVLLRSILVCSLHFPEWFFPLHSFCMPFENKSLHNLNTKVTDERTDDCHGHVYFPCPTRPAEKCSVMLGVHNIFLK